MISEFFLIFFFLADRCRLVLSLTSRLLSIKPESFQSISLLNGSCVLLVEYFWRWRGEDGACPRREREGGRETSVGFLPFSLLLPLPDVNLVGFSVTFIREGDLVHLKRQMKELEANYQEIEKR